MPPMLCDIKKLFLYSWAKDKRSRQAALSGLRKQIKKGGVFTKQSFFYNNFSAVSSKGGGTSDEKLSSSSVQLPSTGLVIHPDQTTDEGYTRLQVALSLPSFLTQFCSGG